MKVLKKCKLKDIIGEGGWCRDAELNHGRRDFQSLALPTELSRHILIICCIGCFSGSDYRIPKIKG